MEGEIVAICSDTNYHTPQPSGYIEWHDWAERMTKTHVQKQCPTCGLWSWWVPIKPLGTVAEQLPNS